MQVVKKGLISLLVLWFALLLFMPKIEIYYALEKVLDKQGIQLNESQMDEGLFTLTLKDVTLFAQGVKVAHIDKIDIFTLLIYTKVTAQTFVVSESLSSMMPKNADNIEVRYSILDPLHVTLNAVGSFGTLKGYIDLKEKKIHIDFVEPKDIRTIRSSLKKGEEGWYYETSF